jgi:hypothetical protein
MPQAGFFPMISASKRSRPSSQTTQPLGPAVRQAYIDICIICRRISYVHLMLTRDKKNENQKEQCVWKYK